MVLPLNLKSRESDLETFVKIEAQKKGGEYIGSISISAPREVSQIPNMGLAMESP